MLDAAFARFALYLRLLSPREMKVGEESEDLQVGFGAERGCEIARKLCSDPLLLLVGIISAVVETDRP
jgi:hypothetical protein